MIRFLNILILFCFFSNNATSFEIPESLEEYVEIIRPNVLERFAQGTRNADNPYNLPANFLPFDVSHEGKTLIYDIFNSDFPDIRSDIKKATKIYELNHNLSICFDKINWKIFDKDWSYKYRIYDMKKNFYTYFVVNEETCQFLMETSTEDVMKYITKIHKNNLPIKYRHFTWFAFTINPNIQYVYEANSLNLAKFKDFTQYQQNKFVNQLDNLSTLLICNNGNHKFYFDKDLMVRVVFLTKDHYILAENTATKQFCK